VTFEVEISGRTRSVTIEPIGVAGPDGGRFRVHLAGEGVEPTEPIEVDARPTDLGLSLILPALAHSMDAAITERGHGEWLIQLPHVDVTALVDRRRTQPGGGQAERAGEQRVLAPMPGRVIRVLVAPGDDVVLRQGLVVVEAMKMENELGAPKAGRVKEIAVVEGASVEAGRLLVVIE
jgi:biotin carboxyl carrier protein